MMKGAEMDLQMKNRQELINKIILDTKIAESNELTSIDSDILKENNQNEDNKDVPRNYIANINKTTVESIKLEIGALSDTPSSNCDIEIKNSKEKSKLSDTDNALSSVNIIISNKESIETSQSVCVGEIVWASFKQTSWFPCLVYLSDSVGTPKIGVKYFNYNGQTAVFPIKNIFKFEGIEEFWHEIMQVRGINKYKITAFNKRCKRAIEQAKLFKTFPICDRIYLLDKITKLEKMFTDIKDLELYLDETIPELPIRENLKFFFIKMKAYDDKAEMIEKVVVKRKIKTEPYQVTKLRKKSIIVKRQLSIRIANRKRKLEDIKDEPASAIKAKRTESPIIKKPKIKKEETLEERFLSNIKDVHYLFRNITKAKVCTKCLMKGDQTTFKCSKNCANWFHESCFEKIEWRKEQVRHEIGDSDDIIETESLKAFHICKSCLNDEKNCFVCHQVIDKDDNESFNCTNPKCKLLYHEKCLINWPKNRNSCPQHYCHTCHSKGSNKNGSLAKCMMCVASYHSDIGCVPAGTQILTRTQIICPRHKSEKEQVKRSKNESKFKPLHINWCSICMKGGELICCGGCPKSFHKDCLGETYQENGAFLMCDKCEEGQLPLYDTIVWARIGKYRWWPAFVMPPWTIPLVVLKRKEFEREFCIRFFGSNDFCFVTCERVIPYDLQSEGIDITHTKSKNKRLAPRYHLALMEADHMRKILNTENEKKFATVTKPKFYNKITQNRPVPPVKLKKIEEHTLEQCKCSPNDPSPCGKRSNCINVILNFECNKSCPAGNKCQNQKLRNRENVDMKIVKTKSRGFGAICVNDIEPNTFIIEYVGEMIDNAELNRRMEKKMRQKDREYYFHNVESDLYVDAEFYANKSRFLNHSCDPNCETRKISVDGNTRIGIFSKKFIHAGSELTFDYKMEFVGNQNTNCYCGSNNCTGLIGDAKKIKDGKKIKKEKKINNVKKGNESQSLRVDDAMI